MNKKKLFLPVLITALALVLIYSVKGIYPFGSSDIGYADMYQSFVPFYYRLWDILHGNEPLFYDWHACGGEGFLSVAMIMSYFSPVNIVFLFIKREMILWFMSLFLGIKLCLLSLSFSYAVHRLFKEINTAVHIFLTLLFTFNGFVLLYYTNIQWLDGVIIVPVLALCMKECIDKGKLLSYTFILTFLLAVNYYIGIMSLFWLFFASGLYIVFYKEKGERGKAVLRLGVSTVSAFVIALPVLVPLFLQLFSSNRVSGNAPGYLSALRSFPSLTAKSAGALLLFDIAPAVALLSVLAVKKCLKRKEAFFAVSLIFMLICAVFCEGVNCIFSLLSYNDFPYRHGFMMCFLGLVLSIGLFQIYMKRVKNKGKANVFVVLIAPMLCIASYFAACKYNEFGFYASQRFLLTVIAILLCVLVFICFMGLDRVSGAITAVAVIISSFMLSFALIAPNIAERVNLSKYRVNTPSGYEYDKEAVKGFEQRLIDDGNKIYALLGDNKDPLCKTKCFDYSLNTNYPFETGLYSYSGWTSAVGEGANIALDSLGYCRGANTRMSSTGGTLFSDALLGYRKAVSYRDPKLEKDEVTGLYDYFKGGLPCADEKAVEYQLKGDICEDVNGLYKALSNKNEKILTRYEDIDYVKSDTEEYISFDVDLKEEYAVYADSVDKARFCAYVNGEEVKVSSFVDNDNKLFPAEFNNRMLNLGRFKGKTSILLKSVESAGNSFADIYIEKIEPIKELYKSSVPYDASAKGNVLDITLKGNAFGYVLVPVAYSENFNVYADGAKVDAKPVLNGLLCGVNVNKGEKNIRFVYHLPYVKEVGIFCAIYAVIYILLVKKFKNTEVSPFGEKVIFGFYVSLFSLSIVFVFIIPPVYGIFLNK